MLIAIPGIHVVGRLEAGAILLGAAKLGLDGADHGLGDLVLDREYVPELPVIAFRPQVVAGCAVDQLGGYAHPLSNLAHAAFEDVVNAKLLGDAAYVGRFPLIGEARIAGDDEEPADARQRRYQVLGDTVGRSRLTFDRSPVR